MGFTDELFLTRRMADEAAQLRAEWIATVSGLQLLCLTGHGRYLLTSGRRGDAGRTIEVEACDDSECWPGAPGDADGNTRRK